jgi:hypothetical protein
MRRYFGATAVLIGVALVTEPGFGLDIRPNIALCHLEALARSSRPC